MSNSYEKRDTLPYTWIGRVPVYATTILVVLEIVGMFITTFLATARVPVPMYMGFSPGLFWKEGFVWTLLTYPLISYPSFFFIFGLFFLYNYGIGVESYLGRGVYFRILAILLLLQPVVSSVIWAITGINAMAAGSFEIVIGIFIAYATLYPNMEMWNWITMKWLAFAGIVLSLMMYLPQHDWMGMFYFSLIVGTAHLLVRYERGHFSLPSWRSAFRKKPKLRVLPRPPAQPRPMPQEEMAESPESLEVDALLDKIARNGLASLTPEERARLEKAREDLLKKDRK